jgi:hypothetical protein
MAANTNGPVEAKVKASTIASYIGAFLLTALANGVQDEDHALILGNAFPEWLETLLLPLLPALASFAAGWAARHTPRPDLGAAGPGGPSNVNLT